MAKQQEGGRRERSSSQEGGKKDKATSEIHEKVLYLNRCSKVVKGGRKFSFSALILVADGKGKIGYGFAKANELTDAIRKGGDAARKQMRKYPMYKTTVPHEVEVKSDGARLILAPAPEGAGVIAGSLVRPILEMAGFKDVTAKVLGGNNPMNVLKATFKALDQLRSRDEIQQSRGLAAPAAAL